MLKFLHVILNSLETYVSAQTQCKSEQLVIFWIYCMTGTSGGKLNNARHRN